MCSVPQNLYYKVKMYRILLWQFLNTISMNKKDLNVIYQVQKWKDHSSSKCKLSEGLKYLTLLNLVQNAKTYQVDNKQSHLTSYFNFILSTLVFTTLYLAPYDGFLSASLFFPFQSKLYASIKLKILISSYFPVHPSWYKIIPQPTCFLSAHTRSLTTVNLHYHLVI